MSDPEQVEQDWSACVSCGRREADVPLLAAASATARPECVDRAVFRKCPVPLTWLLLWYMNAEPDADLLDTVHEAIEKRWREAIEIEALAEVWPQGRTVDCVCLTGGPDRGADCRVCGSYVPITTGARIEPEPPG